MTTEAQIREICEIRGCYIFRVYSCQLVAKILRALVPSWLRGTSTFVESPLQIHPFLCKTNPILSASGGFKMNVSSLITKYYGNVRLCRCGENKPNQTQSCPPSCPA